MNKKIFCKISFVLTIVLIILGGGLWFQQYKKQSQPPISIIIASDMHYLSPDYRGEYFKEPNAMFDGKLIHYSNEYMDAFLEEVTKKQPQALILSGDIIDGSSAAEADPKSFEQFIGKTHNGVLIGDVNNDGLIDAADVQALRKYNANIDTDINTAAADTNLDGIIDDKDFNLLKLYVAGLN